MTDDRAVVVNDRCIPKERILSLDQVVQVMTYWVAELRISDWSIDVEIQPSHRMDDCSGLCRFNYANRHATIQLIDPKNTPDAYAPLDMEQIIVHELLHVVFCALHEWTRSETSPMSSFDRKTIEEQPIDSMAWTLVNMRRRERSRKFAFEE